MKQISSTANPAYKQWLRLVQQPRSVRQMARSVAEGLHLAEAALAAQHPVEAALLRKGTHGSAVDDVLARCAAAGISLYELAPVLYDQLAPVERGAGLCLVLEVPQREFPSVLNNNALNEDALYLDGVQDPGNVGALLRIAAAAGVRHVIASETTAALWSPKALRGAQGAHFSLHLYEHATADDLPRMLNGPWFGAAAHDADSLWLTEMPATAMGWILGGEGQGISADAQARCAKLVTIPLAAGVESLNVAAAAAVCLFERRRRLS